MKTINFLSTKAVFTAVFMFVTMWLYATPIILEYDTSLSYDHGIIIKSNVGFSYTYVGINGTTGSGNGSTMDNISLPGLNGNYEFTIQPNLGFRFIQPDDGHERGLTNVSQWGNGSWADDLTYLFMNCINLKITATDVPNFSNVTNMSGMFWMGAVNNALTTVPSMNSWDTSNVIDMSNMFQFNVSFNEPIGNWNTSKVTNMSGMFSSCTNFNQPIGNWDTSQVTDMHWMFFAAKKFNQPVGNWNTANVTEAWAMFENAQRFNQPIGNWNMSKVTSMLSMFQDAYVFNQDIGNWNVANVTSMESMFRNAGNFNQSLENWVLNANVSLYNSAVNQGIFDNCGMSCVNYSKTLRGWAQNPATPSGRALGAQNVKYGSIGQTFRNQLIAKGWTIRGDSFDAPCDLALSVSDSEASMANQIYPNPTTGIFYLDASDKGQIQVLDLNGKLLKSENYQKGKNMMDISKLPAGIYLIKTEKNSFKLIKN